MAQRSPIRAALTSTPRVVRFSPKGAGPRSRPRRCAHHAVSSEAYAYTALSGPPWTVRSAWSSPATFTPRTATRPLTGSFQIALVAGSPFRSIGRGLPTFTDSTLAWVMGASLAGGEVVTPPGTLVG